MFLSTICLTCNQGATMFEMKSKSRAQMLGPEKLNFADGAIKRNYDFSMDLIRTD